MTVSGLIQTPALDRLTSSLEVEVEASATLSLAMAANAVPLVARVSLTNRGSDVLKNVIVEMALLPDFSEKWSTHVDAIPPGGTFHVDDVELPLDRARLVNQLERSSAELRTWVRRRDDSKPLVTRAQSVDVLAYNEWSRTSVPQILAAFVLPNHPVIAELLRDASALLERLTGSPALDGYQSGEPRRVLAMAQAIYEALGLRGVTYSNPPASFEACGQKIRTPEQVLGEKLATCLDVSVLVAAALEQCGLNPLIVLVHGHAFPAVWLEEQSTRAEGYLDDRATFKKLVNLERIAVFDSSPAVARPSVPFAEATRSALRRLEDPFHYAVDIAGARKQHYRPLPLRVAAGYSAVVEVPVPAPSGVAGTVASSRSAETTAPRAGQGARRHPRIEAWKQRLLDTSLRNRLLNFKDTKQSIDFVCPHGGVVEDFLANGRELAIRPRTGLFGDADPRSKKLVEAHVPGDPMDEFLRERLQQGEIYTAHAEELTTSKLVTILRAAREVLEETGSNALCLTLGMLEWYEADTSEKPRRAPILLVPVTLERDARTGYKLRSSGEDARLNVTLVEKLRRDQGIELPELSELPLDQAGVDVAAVLQRVREAVLNLKRWDVKDEVHLGLFSFAKFQMWADLENNAEVFLESPVVSHLLNGKGEPYPNSGTFPDPAELDDKYSPKDLVCPLDGDASQLAAVAAAAEGKTFVLQGPPGTGKSQTITNLIAHCISRGKRVLFVAEKAAALDVVQRRLTRIGLGPYVLELHSHKAGKAEVLKQFQAALDAQPVTEPPTWESDTLTLGNERASLNDYVRALHKPRAGAGSVFRALSRLIALRDVPLVELPAECADSEQRFASLRAQAEDLRHAAEALSPLASSPWHGCTLPVWEFDLPQRVRAALDLARARLSDAEQASLRLAEALGTAAPRTFKDVDDSCDIATTLAEAPPHGAALFPVDETWPSIEGEGRGLAALARARGDAMARLRARYADALFELDLEAVTARFKKYARAFFLVAWWALRRTRKMLRSLTRDHQLPSSSELIRDLELALAARGQTAELAAKNDRGLALYGAAWQGADSDPAALERALEWASRLYSRLKGTGVNLAGPSIRSVGARALGPLATNARTKLGQLRESCTALGRLLGCDLAPDAEHRLDVWDSLRARFARWHEDVQRLPFFRAFLAASAALTAAGCAPLVDAALRGSIAAAQLGPVFERGVLQTWMRKAVAEDPVLTSFLGEQHHRRVSQFAALDRAHLDACSKVARARLFARAPAAGAGSGGELGVLQKELQKKRRHMPVRKLLGEVSSLAARLKPCFLMSPMSVATYLNPRAPRFDVVVFDEASQIPTHDAIGVLARGSSAIVVGDSKQLPPTSFFQGGDGDAIDEGSFEELESILDECRAAGLPERRLDWHYRSRHETLIAFSNFHYYGNKLNTFPSAAERGAGRGVTLRTVAGFYDKGNARTNRAEADAVVADLVARLRAPNARERTYGIVTFSQAQQQLILNLLDQARTSYPEIEPFFTDTIAEPVIVKNLENIQGDERDVMIFSICYGPDSNGKLSMNFGPLNNDGGERRLNVAITRAREELVVYSTILPEQIDLTRTKAVGVKHLKTFLDYARRGPIAIAEAVTIQARDTFDSPFEEQVCERLRARGYTVHTQVGCAGYRIDMGIVHPERPGRYLLAVECDGAYYHSARSARERDRLRAYVLEGLGWRIHRIWSTDWWQDPERELERLETAIAQAKAELTETPPAVPSPIQTPALPDSQARAPATAVKPQREPVHPDRQPAMAYAKAPPAPAAQWVPPDVPKSDLRTYRVASIPSARRAPEDVHDERYRDELRELLHTVIADEAPISLRVLARRIGPFFGIARTTGRLEDRVRLVLGSTVRVRDDVVWRHDQDPETWSEFRLAPPEAKREAQEIPREEVANAALSVLRGSIALEHDELAKLTARTLGFARVGGNVANQMALGIQLLVKRGVVRKEGNKIGLT